jgi:hypothetical protein
MMILELSIIRRIPSCWFYPKIETETEAEKTGLNHDSESIRPAFDALTNQVLESFYWCHATE